MTLASFQVAFLDALRSDEAALPASWTAREERGFAIYRNAYRTRLVEVLENTFPRTRRLVGDDAFTAAAIHHLIARPPASWNIDDAGLGFEVTLGTLFPSDPDVAECAWLEWSMQQALVCAEYEPMDASHLAASTQAFADEDWHAMRFSFVPGLDVCKVTREWSAIWPMLAEGGDVETARTAPALEPAMGAVVWRDGRTPAFVMVGQLEREALSLMIKGSSYGAMCEALVEMAGEEAAIAGAGGLLAHWLGEGWIAGLTGAPPQRHI